MDLTNYNSKLKDSVYRNKYFSKFINHPRKNLLVTLIIALSLPLTLLLAQQQQIFQPHAANPEDKRILSANQQSIEDNPPEDVVASTDPKVAQVAFNNFMKKVTSLPSTVGTTSKPNVVLLMLDDVNPIDGRFWNGSIMPNTFDNIISKGIRFTNFYGETTLCCPGRVGFLTGQHTQNHGVADLDGTKFDPSETIATELQALGYYTMHDGKYINNYTAIPLSQAIPPGWTKFDAIYNDNGRYYNYNWITKASGTAGTTVYHGSAPYDYSTDVITKTAVQRLKEAPANQPIFAYLTPFAIHGPRTVAERYKGDPRCTNIPAWKAPNVYEQDVSDKSTYIRYLPNGDINRGYTLKTDCEVLLAVDDLVKQVRDELALEGRLDNTIFIFTADNGYGFGEHRIPAKTTPYTTAIPLYIAWPLGRGVTPRVDTTTLSNIDLAETLCEMAGCVMGPYPNGQTKTDGVSFLSLIKDQPASFNRYAILESQPIKPANTAPDTRPPWWAIRTTEQNLLGKWHYVEYETGEKELYDLANGPCYLWTPNKGGDPCELNNLMGPGRTLSAANQAIVAKLASDLILLKKEKGFVPIPSLSPKGFLGNVTCTAISGWTCDPNDYNQALKVNFYLDKPSGSGGTMIGETTADKTREDAVGAQCGGNNNHGFKFTTPESLKDGKEHLIYSYALNIGPAGKDPLLSNSPKAITCSAQAAQAPGDSSQSSSPSAE